MSELLLKLSENPMILVVGILVLSCVLSIPCIIYGKHAKAKQEKFAAENRQNAILLIFGEKITIDGKSLSEFQCIDKSKESVSVVLQPGIHIVSALFGAARNVDRFRPGKEIEVELDLQAGYWYSVGGYEYSAQQRKNYYKGQVPEHILDLPVGNKFLICYKDDRI
ncbi:MAG: hypothetical protein Q4D16_23415 [Eubacteriales bacterium]|nr:hypothetical protein [Eubacteriales bacterium]